MKVSSNGKGFSAFLLFVLPLLYLCLMALFFADLQFFLKISREDRIIEWLTAGALFLSSLMAIALVAIVRRKENHYHWFFVTAAVVLLFGALEEISYGQRLFSVETPEYFSARSDQDEINLHNLLQGMAEERYGHYQSHYFKTRTVAQYFAIVYGVFLPVLVAVGLGQKLIGTTKLVVPPLELAPGFVLAAMLLGDRPTGQEEEYGELFLSLCFLLQMWSERRTRLATFELWE